MIDLKSGGTNLLKNSKNFESAQISSRSQSILAPVIKKLITKGGVCMKKNRLGVFCATSMFAAAWFIATPSQAVPLTAEDIASIKKIEKRHDLSDLMHPRERLRTSMQKIRQKPFIPIGWPHRSKGDIFSECEIKNGIEAGGIFQINGGKRTPTPVPEPSTFLLYGSGLALFITGSRWLLKKGQPR